MPTRSLCQRAVVAGFGLARWSPALAGLLAAQTISLLGDAMATTALILYVRRTMGSATAVGLLLFAEAIPPLAAPFAGVVADRFVPGCLLSAGWLAQAVLAGLLALSLPPLGALLAAVFVLALINTPLSAAVGRCIPAVVADDDLVAANTLRVALPRHRGRQAAWFVSRGAEPRAPGGSGRQVSSACRRRFRSRVGRALRGSGPG